MDGLLILVLIGWAIAQASKKNKKNKNSKIKTTSSVQKETVFQQRTERRARLQAELERKKAQMEQAQKEQASVPAEGEAAAAFTPMEAAFRGSMQVDSTEGECICDPELEHVRVEEPKPESVYAGEIGREPLVDFSARGMMQGVVMSEILTRPAQRVRRR